MKVAIIHDWLDKYAGAEKVFENIIDLFPEASLFSLVDFLEERSFIKNKRVYTSFIQKLPFSKKYFRFYLPLFPLAIESFDLAKYDLIISSSHCVAKSIKKLKTQIHISYVHTPVRYVWDLREEYLKEVGMDKGIKGFIVNLMLDYIKEFDLRTIDRVDYFIANSQYVRERIRRIYGKEARVIYPPVEVNRFSLKENKEDFYLVVSRLEPYKKVTLIVEAFRYLPDKRLVIIGDGSQMKRIKEIAGKNVEILGYQKDEVVRDYMERAKAFVYAAEEDFGIAMAEAQACGTPVVAYRKGGASEIVVDGKTGILFDSQRADSIVDALKRLDRIYERLNHKEIRENALRFSSERFKREFEEFVEGVLERAGQHLP